MLRKIDRPPLQVMINATIVEVTLNDTLRYGVQVFLKGKHVSAGGLRPRHRAAARTRLPRAQPIIGALTDPKVVLDALSEVTEVKVVSSPSVVVVDNQPALLKVGDEVPVSTQQATLLEGRMRADRQLDPVPRHRRDPESDPARELLGARDDGYRAGDQLRGQPAGRADADAHHLAAPDHQHGVGL